MISRWAECGQGGEHTHAQNLLPIPPAPAIIEGHTTSTRAHLSSGQSSEVDVCPALLDRFAMSPANTLGVVERILRLTWWAVAGEMEFGNDVSEQEPLPVETGVVFVHSLEEMDRPFADDII